MCRLWSACGDCAGWSGSIHYAAAILLVFSRDGSYDTFPVEEETFVNIVRNGSKLAISPFLTVISNSASKLICQFSRFLRSSDTFKALIFLWLPNKNDMVYNFCIELQTLCILFFGHTAFKSCFAEVPDHRFCMKEGVFLFPKCSHISASDDFWKA